MEEEKEKDRKKRQERVYFGPAGTKLF